MALAPHVAPSLGNRVSEFASLHVSGGFRMEGAAPGYVAFAAKWPAGAAQVPYVAAGPSAQPFEVGRGTFNAASNVFVRDAVEQTTAGFDGTPATFPAEGIRVFVDPSALDLATLFEHAADRANPHGVTKAQVGLGAVANFLQLVAGANGSDVPDKDAFRRNIGLEGLVAGLQLLSRENLRDVVNKALARENLGVYSVSEVDQKIAAVSNTSLEAAVAFGPYLRIG